MTTIDQFQQLLSEIAPLRFAEVWDNVGLLLGDPSQPIKRVMTCLTITQETVAEAITMQADVIVVHHPLPFKPVSKITTDSPTGRWLWMLASSKIAIYSPHTAWDNAERGINQQLAEILKLSQIRAIQPFQSSRPSDSQTALGVGRIGITPSPLSIHQLVRLLKNRLTNLDFRCNRSLECEVKQVAIVCGSGGSFIAAAKSAGADLLITGEATYHQYLEASNLGLSLLTVGHYASESFAMESLAEMIRQALPEIKTWRCTGEIDAYSEKV